MLQHGVRQHHVGSREAVQCKAARWIKSDYVCESLVTRMLKSLDLDTLQERRRMSRLAFLFKILKETVHKDSVAMQPSDIDIIKNPRRTPEGQPPKDIA